VTTARKLRLTLIAVAAAAVILAACGSSKASTTPPTRPLTNARLVILEPTPNQVTGPDVTLKFEVIGGTVLPPTQVKPLRGDQGHIHVSVDGKLVQMAYSTQTQLTGLSPGSHSVQAAWVASDHLPFANPVVSAVLFRVQ
jgi:hypothetical protein